MSYCRTDVKECVSSFQKDAIRERNVQKKNKKKRKDKNEAFEEYVKFFEKDAVKKKKRRKKHKRKKDKNDLKNKKEVSEEEQQRQSPNIDSMYEVLASGLNFGECKESAISNSKYRKAKSGKKIKGQMEFGGIGNKNGEDFIFTSTPCFVMKKSNETLKKVNVEAGYETDKSDECSHQKRRKIQSKDGFQVDRLEESTKNDKDFKQTEMSNSRSEKPEENRDVTMGKVKNSAKRKLNLSNFIERDESGDENRMRKVPVKRNSKKIRQNSVSETSDNISFNLEQFDLSKTICYETSSSEDGSNFRNAMSVSELSDSEVHQCTTDKLMSNGPLPAFSELKTSVDNLFCDMHVASESEIYESIFLDDLSGPDQSGPNTVEKADATLIKPKPVTFKKSIDQSYLKSKDATSTSDVNRDGSKSIFKISSAEASVISDNIPLHKDGDKIYGLFPIPLKVSDDDEKIVMIRVLNSSNPESSPIFDERYRFTKCS